MTLAQSCDPTTIRVRGSTTCAVTAQNNGDGDATVSITSKVSSKLEITGASGALVNRKKTTAQTAPIVLTAPADGIPAIAPGVTPGEDPTGCKCGYLDLGLFGITPIAVGDESVTNFNVPPFIFGGNTYTRLGVDSNGYIVVGGGTAADNSFAPQTFPDPAAPNGVLAAVLDRPQRRRSTQRVGRQPRRLGLRQQLAHRAMEHPRVRQLHRGR